MINMTRFEHIKNSWQSNAVLRSGMVHNMEPAVYIAGLGGIRLNDNVLVLANGNEVLSSQLPRELDWLVVKA